MQPVVTPTEMAAVDAAAPEPLDELVARAGAAVAWAARRMMGGVYGRRVLVLAGKGLNGEDGRVAAGRLRSWGALVKVVDAADAPASLGYDKPSPHLIIDAAYGTGLSRAWQSPKVPPEMAVLAVDIPSGVNGLTGEVPGGALKAQRTVTFAALKPGLLFPPGAESVGEIEVADIGLDVAWDGPPQTHLVDSTDIAAWLPKRAADAHKWKSACWVVGGSPGMSGAASLAAAAATRGGAGYVRWSVPGEPPSTASGLAVEAVGFALPGHRWAEAMTDAHRFGALVLGPGLGRSDDAQANIRKALAIHAVPAVVDADGLHALAHEDLAAGDLLRTAPTVLTPHDGEFKALTGREVGVDRIASARSAAVEMNAVVLLKGPCTVVAQPDGQVLLANQGDARLATAGTGDVLSGLIGSLLAAGIPAFRAAAMGAWIHGRAATLLPKHGMVAGDLLSSIPQLLESVTADR